jgi:hypothetical protein
LIVSWDTIKRKCNELGVSCEFLDTHYNILDSSTGFLLALSNNEYRALIARSRELRTRLGVGGEFDCDDYARIYQAIALAHGFAVSLAIGIIETEGFRMGHAYNVLPWYVSKDRVEFFLVEPQNVINNLPFIYHMKTNIVEGVLFMRVGLQKYKYTTLHVVW